MEKKQTSFVVKIDENQRRRLEAVLQEKGWDFSEAPYAHWKVSGPKINLVAYCSGKLTVQGGNAAEFVEFTLEPEILGALLDAGGGSTALADLDKTPHGGVDESGKGDFFGPLVVACVYSGGEVAERLAAAGVCDSKMISSDRKIAAESGTCQMWHHSELRHAVALSLRLRCIRLDDASRLQCLCF